MSMLENTSFSKNIHAKSMSMKVRRKTEAGWQINQ